MADMVMIKREDAERVMQFVQLAGFSIMVSVAKEKMPEQAEYVKSIESILAHALTQPKGNQ